jgi:hypothetical protein
LQDLHAPLVAWAEAPAREHAGLRDATTVENAGKTLDHRGRVFLGLLPIAREVDMDIKDLSHRRATMVGTN